MTFWRWDLEGEILFPNGLLWAGDQFHSSWHLYMLCCLKNERLIGCARLYVIGVRFKPSVAISSGCLLSVPSEILGTWWNWPFVFLCCHHWKPILHFPWCSTAFQTFSSVLRCWRTPPVLLELNHFSQSLYSICPVRECLVQTHTHSHYCMNCLTDCCSVTCF